MGASAGPVAEFVEVRSLSGCPRSQRAAPVPEPVEGCGRSWALRQAQGSGALVSESDAVPGASVPRLCCQFRFRSLSRDVRTPAVPFDQLRDRVVRFRRAAPFPGKRPRFPSSVAVPRTATSREWSVSVPELVEGRDVLRVPFDRLRDRVVRSRRAAPFHGKRPRFPSSVAVPRTAPSPEWSVSVPELVEGRGGCPCALRQAQGPRFPVGGLAGGSSIGRGAGFPAGRPWVPAPFDRLRDRGSRSGD